MLQKNPSGSCLDVRFPHVDHCHVDVRFSYRNHCYVDVEGGVEFIPYSYSNTLKNI